MLCPTARVLDDGTRCEEVRGRCDVGEITFDGRQELEENCQCGLLVSEESPQPRRLALTRSTKCGKEDLCSMVAEIMMRSQSLN